MTDARDLYGLPIDRFVAERGALAKALRAEGQREEAASVAGLRKPSVAAWAVNQLVRTQGPAVASLFEAGDALQRAQSELLGGRGDARALRQAAERERAAVDELSEISRGLLSSAGHELTQATLDRVSATLHAAALDEEARGQARDGCLERELHHVGFGMTGGATGSAASGRAGTRPPRNSAKPGKSRHAKSEAAARRTAKRTARELDAAQARRDRAADALRTAEDALQEAREHSEAAADGHRRAQEPLEDR